MGIVAGKPSKPVLESARRKRELFVEKHVKPEHGLNTSDPLKKYSRSSEIK